MLVFFALDNAKVLSFALGEAKLPNTNGFASQWNIGFKKKENWLPLTTMALVMRRAVPTFPPIVLLSMTCHLMVGAGFPSAVQFTRSPTVYSSFRGDRVTVFVPSEKKTRIS